MNDLATAAVADVPSGTWQIDPAHSVIGFSVRHLMSKVRGTFDEFTGDLTIADDRGRSAATIDIAMTSVNIGHDMRDDDLRTSNFFDVAQHPTMTYASTGLREADGSWVLDGKLTVRGTTRDVQIDMEFLGYEPTGLQGEPRVGFAGHTSINRSDFGITFGLADSGKVVVGDKVDISLDVEAFLNGGN